PIVDYNWPAHEDSQQVRKRHYRENSTCKQRKVFQIHGTCPMRPSIASLTRNRASRLHKGLLRSILFTAVHFIRYCAGFRPRAITIASAHSGGRRSKSAKARNRGGGWYDDGSADAMGI